MATKETEKTNVTGLADAVDKKEAEYDLMSALLKAAAFKDTEIKGVSIKRNGEFLFKVRIHPLSDSDIKEARKKAGIYKDNPTNRKLGKVKVDSDDAKFGSWLIYMATIEEDQQKIWGNPTIMSNHGLMQPWESIDVLLMTGEKGKLLDEVFKLSGMDEEEDEQDEETFLE